VCEPRIGVEAVCAMKLHGRREAGRCQVLGGVDRIPADGRPQGGKRLVAQLDGLNVRSGSKRWLSTIHEELRAGSLGMRRSGERGHKGERDGEAHDWLPKGPSA
jgi:hypothetical protein